MKTPSEMANEELGRALSDWDIDTIPELISAAVIRLRALPETEPDFYVGWAGETRHGQRAEIFAERDGYLFGLVVQWKIPPIVARWNIGGEFDPRQGEAALDLIPNTPPEPEIRYRRVSHPDALYASVDQNMAADPNWQKVSVQVIP